MLLDYFSIQIGQAPPEIRGDAPFRCILAVNGKADDAWRGTISEWLVSAGCLYLMVWGEDAEVWHDAVDKAHLQEFDYGDVPDNRFVMTTWHDNESLEDVMILREVRSGAPDDRAFPIAGPGRWQHGTARNVRGIARRGLTRNVPVPALVEGWTALPRIAVAFTNGGPPPVPP